MEAMGFLKNRGYPITPFNDRLESVPWTVAKVGFYCILRFGLKTDAVITTLKFSNNENPRSIRTVLELFELNTLQ